MPKRRFFQIPCVIFASPFLLFALFYSMRWVMTGQWVEGGGERALLGLFVGTILMAPVAIAEIEC